MKKKILVLENSSKVSFGGGQKVTLEVMNILKDKYEIILVDSNKKTKFNEQGALIANKTFLLPYYGEVVGGSGSSFSIGILEVLLFPFYYFFNLINLIVKLKKLKCNKVNTLVYTSTKKTAFTAYGLKKILGLDYIYHGHNSDSKDNIFYKIANITFKEAKKIICVSDLVKNNINLKQCVRIYNPIKVYSVKEKSIENKDKIIVASFSALIKWKGLEYFMKSFSHLKNKDKVEYWIFGEGKEKEDLKQYENTNVFLKGFSTNSEKLMEEQIDIIIMPSIANEACPMVPLEAFGCGLPVITTNIGGQAEIVKDNHVGFLVDIKNEKVIAEKIDHLIDNPAIYSEFSKNSKEHSKNFDIKAYQNQILKEFSF